MSGKQPADIGEIEDVEDDEYDEFVKTIQLDELCAVASRHRGGVACILRKHKLGSTNLRIYWKE